MGSSMCGKRFIHDDGGKWQWGTGKYKKERNLTESPRKILVLHLADFHLKKSSRWKIKGENGLYYETNGPTFNKLNDNIINNI